MAVSILAACAHPCPYSANTCDRAVGYGIAVSIFAGTRGGAVHTDHHQRDHSLLPKAALPASPGPKARASDGDGLVSSRESRGLIKKTNSLSLWLYIFMMFHGCMPRDFCVCIMLNIPKKQIWEVGALKSAWWSVNFSPRP
jgi:hypothetical protein